MPKQRVLDAVVVYEIVKRLSKPFRETDAYRLGLIDEKGNILKKRKHMNSEERRAVSLFDIMIFNVKRLLAKLPGGDSRLRNFATALFLLREDINEAEVNMEMLHELADDLDLQSDTYMEMFLEHLCEDEGSAPSTNTTANIAQKDMPLKTSKVGKCKVFHVNGDTFSRCKTAKGKNDRFKKFVGEGPECEQIRQYARKNPGSSIMLRDDSTGAHTFLKIGSKSRF